MDDIGFGGRSRAHLLMSAEIPSQYSVDILADAGSIVELVASGIAGGADVTDMNVDGAEAVDRARLPKSNNDCLSLLLGCISL